MTPHYDRTSITEEPIPEEPGLKYIHIPFNLATNEKIKRLIEIRNIKKSGIIDADQDQRDQLTTRLSLRREK